ncbi:hypothetical protein [Paracoccus lutimaris]|uniref:DUF4239 domain-containing protein n=1 Tax=Paracoccus lutimaris TaxID=1490030 RepID=A0A368ZBC6_9RHOB|nr:hypothetical protein [Paracoccus lutimaris]RCW88796.1 hypothetical protein DFP89_101232 [Paracoccus lutimaris]
MIEYLYEILQTSQTLFFVTYLACLLFAIALGRRVGQHRRKVIGDRADEGANLVVGSLLGLMAFVLALNLSAATSRYEMRMGATLEEVNAIGTAMMQAGAVGGDQAESIAADLGQYLQLRYRYVRATRLTGEIQDINAQTNALQNKIWADVTRRVQESQTPATSSMMNAVNNAFDSSTAMRLAMEYRMPLQVIGLLLLMSVLGAAAVGYQFGLTQRKGRWPGILLSILWCVVVTEIIDIGSARIWAFRTDTRVYEWSMESAGIPLPPDVE